MLEWFKDNIRFENGWYTVCLPWKEAIDIIPDNFQLCKAKLHSLIKRLISNPKLLQEYDKIIKGQQQEVIVEDVNKVYDTGSVHYIPHREVVCEDKDTTKICIVHDGRAKVKMVFNLTIVWRRSLACYPIFSMSSRYH